MRQWLVGIIKVILVIILSFVPLFPATEIFGYEQGKVFLFVALMLVALTLLIIDQLLLAKIAVSGLSRIGQFATIFIAILIFSSLQGVHPFSSFFGSAPYFQGVIVYSFLYLFYLSIKFARITFFTFSLSTSVSASIVAINAIIEWFLLHLRHYPIPTYGGRVVSTFGQPNLYSGFLLLSIPLDFYLFQKGRGMVEKGMIILLLLIKSIAIVMSESRASIGLLIVTALVFVLYQAHLKARKYYVHISVSILLTVSFLFGLFFLPKLLQTEIYNPQNSHWVITNAPEKRVLIWEVAFRQAFKRPLLGYGVDSFRYVYKNYFDSYDSEDEVSISRKKIAVDRAHNYSLDLITGVGLVGFVIWCLLVFYSFKKVQNRFVILTLLIYLIWIQLQIQSIVHLIFFWGLLGVIDASKEREQMPTSLEKG